MTYRSIDHGLCYWIQPGGFIIQRPYLLSRAMGLRLTDRGHVLIHSAIMDRRIQIYRLLACWSGKTVCLVLPPVEGTGRELLERCRHHLNHLSSGQYMIVSGAEILLRELKSDALLLKDFSALLENLPQRTIWVSSIPVKDTGISSLIGFRHIVHYAFLLSAIKQHAQIHLFPRSDSHQYTGVMHNGYAGPLYRFLLTVRKFRDLVESTENLLNIPVEWLYARRKKYYEVG